MDESLKHQEIKSVDTSIKNVPENEKAARFLQLRSIFERKNGSLNDLMQNMYKYAGEVSIPGVQKQDTARTFEQAASGCEIIEQALNVYLHTQKERIGANHNLAIHVQALQNDISRHSPKFNENESNRLNVDKLCKLADWTFNVWIVMGEKYGRPSTISSGQIPGLVNDLRDILDEVNQVNAAK